MLKRGGRVKRILIVDDEAPVLESLRIRLHRMQSKWEMSFVDSGVRALEQLDQHHFDVLVTDMRMPGMDGPALLQACQKRWPDVIRLVLSGYTDPALLNRALAFTHQYLEKPCEPRRLENVIDRCLGLHELLNRPALRSLVGRVRQLPALPRTFARLQPLLHSERTSARDVSEVISADAAVTARVLQMVNSAFFRHARRITNIEQAVTYLGFATTRNLVMAAEVFGLDGTGSAFAMGHLNRLQEHAQRVAAGARALATGTVFEDDAMLAALLHDIGYWVLLQECPDELQQAIHNARAANLSLPEAEIQAFGASHAELGAYLLGLWGLPYPIIEAVAHHHAPQRIEQTRFDVLAAVAIAHSLSDSQDVNVWDEPAIPHDVVDAAYLASIDAPFDWAEAQRRVSENLRSPEAQP
jgi:HD-like signal output (HDOD) protein/ActR/RegA family two-component response regulator